MSRWKLLIDATSCFPFEKEKNIWNFYFSKVWNSSVVVDEEIKKRRKMDIKLESEDANFAFPEGVNGSQSEKIASRNGVISRSNVNATNSIGRIIGVTRPRQAMGVLSKRPPPAHQGPITLTSQLSKQKQLIIFFKYYFSEE